MLVSLSDRGCCWQLTNVRATAFILELLLPGVVAVLAGLLIAVEFQGLVVEEALGGSAVVLLAALFAASYLCGLCIRHLPHHGVPSSGVVYADHLAKTWATYLPELVARWGTSYDSVVGSDPGNVTVEQISAIVQRLRDYQLSTYQAAWSDYLTYHWNVARASRNCQIPLALLAGASMAAMLRSAAASSLDDVIRFGLLTAASALVAIGLRHVYFTRTRWHMDTIVRAEQAHYLQRNAE